MPYGEEMETSIKLAEAAQNASENAVETASNMEHVATISSNPGAFEAEGKELEGMSVLLVEDNAMNQQMAKFSIMKCGAELEIAGHGEYAVAFVKDRFEKKLPNYDCILMDMMMPVMDGITATAEIRKLEKEYGVAPHNIVGLSANVGPEYTQQIKEAGMNGSMSKPFYPATLRNTLSSILKGTYAGFDRFSDEFVNSIASKPGN